MNSRNRPREASQKRLSLASDNVPNHRTLTQRPGCHLLLSGLSTTTSHHDHQRYQRPNPTFSIVQI